jgi:hypothetical protein
MKAVLALLLSFVFVQTQAFAISGGPDYGNLGQVTGTYAGALFPSGSTLESGTPSPGANNSLGLFAIGVPSTGLASGIALYFTTGDAFTGSIVGVADPGEEVIRAVMTMQSTVPTTTTDPITGLPTISQTTNAIASGSLKADISTTNNGGASLTRLEGAAELDTQTIAAGGALSGATTAIVLIVDGFQQSAATSGTIDLSTLTNTLNNTSATGG